MRLIYHNEDLVQTQMPKHPTIRMLERNPASHGSRGGRLCYVFSAASRIERKNESTRPPAEEYSDYTPIFSLFLFLANIITTTDTMARTVLHIATAMKKGDRKLYHIISMNCTETRYEWS